MSNNNFCEMNIKQVTYRGGLGNCNYQYLLGYTSILLGYPSNIHTCIPSICSWRAISLTQRIRYLSPPFPNTLVFELNASPTPLLLIVQSWNKVIRKEKCFSNTMALIFLVIYVYLFFKQFIYTWQNYKFLITIFKYITSDGLNSSIPTKKLPNHT